MTCKTIYLCNRKACEKCSYPECKHTLNINYAKNFYKDIGGNWIEEESVKKAYNNKKESEENGNEEKPKKKEQSE